MLKETHVRETILGGISRMTLARWKRAGFPQPMTIRGRNYYSRDQVDYDIPAWLAAADTAQQ